MGQVYYVVTVGDKYLETIYRNSISTDSDLGDAIKFNTQEVAQNVKAFIGINHTTLELAVKKVETVMTTCKGD